MGNLKLSTPYPWHIDPPIHGISTPYPWHIDPPTHGKRKNKNNNNKNNNNNKKRSKNNKSPKLCLGDLIIIIIRNGTKTISLQTLFGRLN
jgi:hypothetical protein